MSALSIDLSAVPETVPSMKGTGITLCGLKESVNVRSLPWLLGRILG